MAKGAHLPANFYAATEEDAASRYAEWCEDDPFPDIQPALLNSGDIRDYVAATGMLVPFTDEEDKLKPASYEVVLEGHYIYWDAAGKKLTGTIDPGDTFVLEANSIAFVTVRPTFRLPAYIAVRFNLRIHHVYRGLLLGTGPLVDPGFVGKLSIPLHNLTSNDYEIKGGDGLIWMEFTKLSPDRLRERNPKAPLARHGEVRPLPDEKKDKDVYWYVAQASPHEPVRSSIPLAADQAMAAASEVKEQSKRFTRISLVATLALLVGIGALMWQAIGVVRDANEALDDQRREVLELRATVDRLEEALLQPRSDPNGPTGQEP